MESTNNEPCTINGFEFVEHFFIEFDYIIEKKIWGM